jgi:uracil DNA glycosylase
MKGIDYSTKQPTIYPSFNDTDHFGIANNYLEEKYGKSIDWRIV